MYTLLAFPSATAYLTTRYYFVLVRVFFTNLRLNNYYSPTSFWSPFFFRHLRILSFSFLDGQRPRLGSQMRSLFKFKTKYPQYCANLLPSEERNVFVSNMFTVIPYRDQHGRRVLIAETGGNDLQSPREETVGNINLQSRIWR